MSPIVMAVVCLLVAGGAPSDPVVPPEVGQQGWLLLTTGEAHSGRVTHADRERVVLARAGGWDGFRREQVRGMVTATVPYGDPVGDGRHLRLILSDGSVRTGLAVQQGPDVYAIGVTAGVETYAADRVRVAFVPREQVRELETRVRWLAAPGAHTLRPGELQAGFEGMHAVLSAGLTSWLGAGAGFTVPAYYAEAYPASGRAWLRASLPLGRLLRISGGAVLEGDAKGTGAAYLSGAATLALPRARLGVYAGPRFPGAEEIAPLGEVAVALTGAVPVGRRVELMGEYWLSGEGGFGVAGARGRFGRVALDVGVAGLGETFSPWFGLAVDVTPWRVSP